MADAPQTPQPSEDELQRMVMPTILELQKLLVDRIKAGTMKPEGGGQLDAISITSCEHHSCH